MVHKVAHIVQRGDTFYYNRRVPKSVSDNFGQKVVRVKLGTDLAKAEYLSAALSDKLSDLWAATLVKPVCVNTLLSSLEPRHIDLVTCAEMYLDERDIGPKPVRLAVETCISQTGNKDVRSYTRSEARRVIEALLAKGNKSATVRRRIQSLHALFEFGFHELDENKRNPFARLTIPQEGKDATRRGVFSDEQLAQLYSLSLKSGKDTRLIFPILGETGARLAEIVGLRWQDVCLEQGVIRITPHALRRLKTAPSERAVPLVGAAWEAMRELHRLSGKHIFVLPRWCRETGCLATHASNTLNKYLRNEFENLTCHCFRHTMRDRLRNAGAPIELIDNIGGWKTAVGVGSRYGIGYSSERKRDILEQIAI